MYDDDWDIARAALEWQIEMGASDAIGDLPIDRYAEPTETTQVDIEYYTGFKTQFFQSPTRPWYVLIPSDGKPIAIIPTIGESGMRETWIDDILCVCKRVG